MGYPTGAKGPLKGLLYAIIPDNAELYNHAKNIGIARVFWQYPLTPLRYTCECCNVQCPKGAGQGWSAQKRALPPEYLAKFGGLKCLDFDGSVRPCAKKDQMS
ncbi:MAG: hypothetical protein COB46_11905 [Rhodospirillaceae bacterium]|nr:MAG: hypothetical protein COB46_11905 [Rhodospirillaceae bacterium]